MFAFIGRCKTYLVICICQMTYDELLHFLLYLFLVDLFTFIFSALLCAFTLLIACPFVHASVLQNFFGYLFCCFFVAFFFGFCFCVCFFLLLLLLFLPFVAFVCPFFCGCVAWIYFCLLLFCFFFAFFPLFFAFFLLFSNLGLD